MHAENHIKTTDHEAENFYAKYDTYWEGKNEMVISFLLRKKQSEKKWIIEYRFTCSIDIASRKSLGFRHVRKTISRLSHHQHTAFIDGSKSFQAVYFGNLVRGNIALRKFHTFLPDE